MVSPNNYQGTGLTSQRARDRLVERLRKQGVRNEKVLEVIRTTPRHFFMDEAMDRYAYDDAALPIGHQQTISQPYTVARMTEEMLLTNPRKILEVGTGSGYQAAVLAQLVSAVYTVERIGDLLRQTRERFTSLNLKNILIKHGDGSLGWPEYAPFDGIIVTAAFPTIPSALLSQLAVGGRLIMPLGQGKAVHAFHSHAERGGSQLLTVITHTPDGFVEKCLEKVTFVPLCSGVI